VVVAGLATSAASSATPAVAVKDDPVLQAMRDELSRYQALKLASLDAPYYLSASIDDGKAFAVEATFGALQSRDEGSHRNAHVVVHVGAPELDDQNFVDREHFNFGGFLADTAAGPVPNEPDYDALRQALWLRFESKEDTRWQGTLDRMFFLGRVSRADYILFGRFVRASVDQRQQDVRFAYDPEALKSYKAEYAKWASELSHVVDHAEQALNSYDNTFEQAKARFITEGGKVGGEKPQPADEIVRSHELISNGARARVSEMKRALSSVPSPQDLEQALSQKATQETRPFANVDLFLKLLDVERGEVIWGARIREGARTDDGTLDPALRPALDKVLDLVLANSGSTTRQVAR
jgi:hypothetical protein